MRVCNLKQRYWIIFFAIGQLALAILTALSLSVFSWVKIDFDVSFFYLDKSKGEFEYFEAKSFEGSFYSCLDGCNK